MPIPAGFPVARLRAARDGDGRRCSPLGLGTLAYSAGIEVRNFVVRRVEVPVLPAGHRPLKVLHVSDLHLTPSQGAKRRWLASLADLEPDLVIDTGDNLAHPDSVGPVVEGLGPLLDVPGVFVMGSNDYFAPSLRNPLWYLFPDDGQRNIRTPKLPWDDLRAAFESRGWSDLTNTRGRLSVGGTTIAFAGVDDPHLGYDDLDAVAGPAPADADLRIGVAHAPYLRVLDQYAHDGYDLTSSRATPTAARCACRAAAPSSPTATSSPPGPRACTATRPLAARRSRLRLAARVRRSRHLAVRPDPAVLPSGGHPAHPDRRVLSLAESRFGAGSPVR